MFVLDAYLAQLTAWVLLHFAWQGVFVILSLRGANVFLRESTSTFRYRVFRVHLIALVAAPLLTLLISHDAVASAAPAGTPGPHHTVASLPAWLPSLLLPPFHLLVGAVPYILALWTGGAVIGAGLLLGGHLRSCFLRRFYPGRHGWIEVAGGLARSLGIKTPPAILEGEVGSPFVFGVRKQRLVLPRRMEQQLPPEEFRAILAHELAHVKRSDYASNLVQTAVAIMLWPHPAAWIVRAQLRHEREACCDEVAIQLCGSAAPLARALYRLSADALPYRHAVPALGGPLEFRLQRLLSARRASPSLLSGAPSVFALSALALATVLLAQTLPTDAATRTAMIASPFGPTILVRAHDPAGAFLVQLRRGRVLGVSIAEKSIPSAQIIQEGDSVRVLDSSGRDILDLRVDARGGIAWNSRSEGPQATF